ncbi:hypothetical protein CBM2637_B80006 [Cupriavidus taiwanensis]|nr:hypothetical protein CBM2637_B80006 [Cupriavidus taiwanensis]
MQAGGRRFDPVILHHRLRAVRNAWYLGLVGQMQALSIERLHLALPSDLNDRLFFNNMGCSKGVARALMRRCSTNAIPGCDCINQMYFKVIER